MFQKVSLTFGLELAWPVLCASSMWTRSGIALTHPVSNCPYKYRTLLMNLSGDYAIPALIANVELCVGVLAANLPTYRPLITTIISGRRATDTRGTSRAAGSYFPVKDSLQVPLSNHFYKQGASNSELDDMEMLSGNAEHKVQTHISNDEGAWPGPRNNKIRVTTSFNTS